MDENTKLLQDFLDENNLILQLQPRKIRMIEDNSIIIENPALVVVKKQPEADPPKGNGQAPIVEGEVVKNGK